MWRKRTQDQADSEQMNVADKAPGTTGGGLGLLSVGREWIASMVFLELRSFEE